MCPKHQPVTKFPATGLGKTCCVDNRSLRHFRSSRDHQSSPVQTLALSAKGSWISAVLSTCVIRFFCFFVRCSQYMHHLRAFSFPAFKLGRVGATDITSNATRVPIS